MTPSKRPFLSTSLFTLLGRSGGILIPFVIAFVYGADPTTDAFFLAFTLVLSLVSFFNPVFELVMVPYLAEHRSNPRKVAELANSFVIFCLPLIVGAAVLLGFCLGPALAKWSGMGAATSALSSRIFFEMIPVIVLWVWSSGCNSIFYTHKLFWFPALSPLFRSLTVIASLLAFKPVMGIHGIAAGYIGGEVLRWGASVSLLTKKTWWTWQIRWRESRAKFFSFLGQAGYQILALLAINLVPLVDQWFASWFGEGNLSLMSYADRLFKIPHQFFIAGMLPIYLAHWSDSFIEEKRSRFWEHINRDIMQAFVITTLFSIACAAISYPLIRLCFGLSEFSADQLRTLGDLFFWLILGFGPAALNLLFIRVLFVMKKSSVFCMQAWLRLGLNVVFNFLFTRWWGLIGIPIATTTVYTLTFVWLYLYVKKHREPDAEAKK